MGRPTTRSRGIEAETMDPAVAPNPVAPNREDSSQSQPRMPNPPPPMNFWWHQSKFGTTAKLGSRLEMEGTLKLLDKDSLTIAEKSWFLEHPQFKHLWHMKNRKNMLTGMWLLLVRSIKTEKKKEAWFVVNGVPIRYSLREHALITGFDCHKYPANHENLGSLEMVKRVFGRDSNIRPSDIEGKYLNMLKDREMTDEIDGDVLHIAVLLLLANVICGKKRDDAPVDEFTLRMAGDLDACKKFPWGRLTFEGNINNIFHTAARHKGRVPKYWIFPGFCLPLQLLAFEAIPNLASRFQDVVTGANIDCPRMCKSTFKPHAVRSGFSLPYLNEALGKTTVRYSFLCNYM